MKTKGTGNGPPVDDGDASLPSREGHHWNAWQWSRDGAPYAVPEAGSVEKNGAHEERSEKKRKAHQCVWRWWWGEGSSVPTS